MIAETTKKPKEGEEVGRWYAWRPVTAYLARERDLRLPWPNRRTFRVWGEWIHRYWDSDSDGGEWHFYITEADMKRFEQHQADLRRREFDE